MQLLLKFLHENDLSQYIVKYESELLKRNILRGTDEASYVKYFNSIESISSERRCVTKEIKDNLFKLSIEEREEFKTYAKNAEAGKAPTTNEYNLFSYLSQAPSPDLQQALSHALTDNDLTLDKRYFYLLCTVPFKTCD